MLQRRANLETQFASEEGYALARFSAALIAEIFELIQLIGSHLLHKQSPLHERLNSMRVFHFNSFSGDYLEYFAQRYPSAAKVSYSKRLSLLLAHRYNATHILDPVYRNDPKVKFTIGNDVVLQRAWAEEHGLASAKMDDILLAQIEEHCAEVVYVIDPVRW